MRARIEKNTKKQKTDNIPKSPEWELAKFCFDKIKENFPNHYPNRTWGNIQDDWEKKTKKLIKESNRPIEYVQKAFAWALSGVNEYHAKNFRGIPGLFSVWKNGIHYAVLFEDYDKSQAQPEDIFIRKIESIVKYYWDGTDLDSEDKKDEINRCLDTVDWFQDRLDAINRKLTAKNSFTWHESDKYIKIVEWLMDLEENSFKKSQTILSAYLEFLQYRLQDGSISTLYPGYFSNKSELFRQYLAEDYKVTGRKLMDWQKGDFDD